MDISYLALILALFALAGVGWLIWYKPDRDAVRELICEWVGAHEKEKAEIAIKADSSQFVNRLGKAVEAVENACAEAANPQQAPCADCGQVYIVQAMQRIETYYEFPYGGRSSSMFRDDDYNERKAGMPLFYCPAHTKPYQVAVRMHYDSINAVRGEEAERERQEWVATHPAWRYYNIVPAQPGRWDEVPAEVAAKKRGRPRKAAAEA